MSHQRTKPSARTARAEAALAAYAAAHPETREDNPWGERAFKVKGKTFLFMAAGGDGIGLSVKLPDSADIALSLPFAEPTGYGLGKSGWVSANFAPDDDVPVELLKAWIDESFRAIAPKKLVAGMAQKAPPAAKKKVSNKTNKEPNKKPSKRKKR
jgi:predicted DNA-binding protein (MmcQ/YjbR family)